MVTRFGKRSLSSTTNVTHSTGTPTRAHSVPDSPGHAPAGATRVRVPERPHARSGKAYLSSIRGQRSRP
eukprot:1975587-Rhodomonas_salina.2